MKLNTFKIQMLLAEQGLSKTAFAERCGIARQNISIIMGRGTCTPVTAGRIAKGLGISVAEIVKKE